MSNPGYQSFRLAGSALGRGRDMLLMVYLALSAPVLLVSLIIAVVSLPVALVTLNAGAGAVALCNAGFVGHIVGLIMSVKPISRRSWIWRWYTLGAVSELGLATLFRSMDNQALHHLFYIVVLLFPCAIIGAVASFKAGSSGETSPSTKSR